VDRENKKVKQTGREKVMGRFSSPLDHVRIAAPCKADWEQMIGTERVRFCGQCNLNVYNLSSMTKTEAESLIAQTEGRLCARFYRRRDGSILTYNCPVGLRAIRRRLSYLAKVVSAAVLSFFAGLGVYRTVSNPLPPPALMGMIAMPGNTGLSDQEPGTTVHVVAEVGEALIRRPLENPAERKAMRRRDRWRREPTR
jgi:hypothetical protein